MVIEPKGSTWEPHSLVTTVKDADGSPLFTEIILAGNADPETPLNASAQAGSEVRFRVLNSGNASPGNMTNSTKMIVVDGHDWQEEPYIFKSTVIGDNKLSQHLGSQQVTTLESYNLILPSAGGKKRQPGDYNFFYYPTGSPLGTLKVTK